MENKKNKTIIDKIWDQLASVKLAVIIFAAISLTSIIGTILEQGAEPEKNIKLLMKLFGVGQQTAIGIYDVLDSMHFMDMYHSWWFVTLLLLFGANLIICSLDRLPRILKLVNEKIRPLPAEHIEKMSIKREMTIKGKPSGIKESALVALKSIGFKPSESIEEAGIQLYAEKGNFTRLGVYLTHLSVLVILAGAIIGIFFGFNAFLNLPEGATSSVAYQDRGREVPLGFEIRCDNFEVDFYDTSDMPKAYRSWLTVFKDGKEVMKKSIVVNDPLKYEGITFYQSSYGMVPDNTKNGIIVLKMASRDGRPEQINSRIGESFTIPGTAIVGKITDFSPALSIDENGRSFTYGEMMTNPAIYIEFTEAGKQKFSGWLLKRYPQTWNLPDGNRVEFLDYWGVEYTGMQVRRDPGVFFVYLGCLLMSIGLYITFFMNHKRIWITITEDRNTAKIVIGASANKNRAAFERKVEKLTSILNTAKKGGK